MKTITKCVKGFPLWMLPILAIGLSGFSPAVVVGVGAGLLAGLVVLAVAVAATVYMD